MPCPSLHCPHCSHRYLITCKSEGLSTRVPRLKLFIGFPLSLDKVQTNSTAKPTRSLKGWPPPSSQASSSHLLFPPVTSLLALQAQAILNTFHTPQNNAPQPQSLTLQQLPGKSESSSGLISVILGLHPDHSPTPHPHTTYSQGFCMFAQLLALLQSYR